MNGRTIETTLDAGAGPALNAELQWVRHLAHCRNNGREHRADALQTLLGRIEGWRDATAEKLGMAPGAVLPSHLTKAVAYAMPSTAEASCGSNSLTHSHATTVI